MASNTKSQTATEYLIILAVVIVIAMIVVGVLGGIPSIGVSAQDRALLARWKTESPVAISTWKAGNHFTVIDVKNNGAETLTLHSVELANLDFFIEEILSIGQKHRLKVPGN